jgi:hypothetical protein
MTERIDIAKARELLEGTTKGEWRNDGPDVIGIEAKRTITYGVFAPRRQKDDTEANARWIAHAHNHYAALLDELEGARAEIAYLRTGKKQPGDLCPDKQIEANGYCLGMQRSRWDDEPADRCKKCQYIEPELGDQEGRT